jgi:hypothetical protein
MRRPLLALAVAALLCGCATTTAKQFGQGHAPVCEYRGSPGTPIMVLEAQAVPTASLLPCVKLLPSGWSLSGGALLLRNGEARFALDSDRVGVRAVTVVLQPSCELAGATRVPSDEAGAERYERIDTLTAERFTGAQLYVFPGGCVTYRFAFTGEGRAVPISEVTQALGFVSRADVRTAIDAFTRGRYQLDPPGGGG